MEGITEERTFSVKEDGAEFLNPPEWYEEIHVTKKSKSSNFVDFFPASERKDKFPVDQSSPMDQDTPVVQDIVPKRSFIPLTQEESYIKSYKSKPVNPEADVTWTKKKYLWSLQEGTPSGYGSCKLRKKNEDIVMVEGTDGKRAYRSIDPVTGQRFPYKKAAHTSCIDNYVEKQYIRVYEPDEKMFTYHPYLEKECMVCQQPLLR